MKAKLLFREKWSEPLLSGRTLTVFMDCYQLAETQHFAKAFKFSWIAYDIERPEDRVLMDQHVGRPCHLHVGSKDRQVDLVPKDIDDALDLFFKAVRTHFGPITEVTE